jgi:hypothetical protein
VSGHFGVGKSNESLDIQELRWRGIGYEEGGIKGVGIEFDAEISSVCFEIAIEVSNLYDG